MKNFTAIILAAGQGTRLRPLTDDIPKCMVEVAGKPLFIRQLETLKKCGIKNIVVATGYKEEVIPGEDVTKIFNKNYATTNMIESLLCAEKYIKGDLIISYGDIIYSESVLKSLMENKNDIVIASDEEWRPYWESRCEDPLDDAESFEKGEGGKVRSLGKKAKKLEEIEGQYIGLIKLSPVGCTMLKNEYHSCKNDIKCNNNAWNSGRDFKNAYMTDLMNFMASKGKLHYHPIFRGWFEVDNHKDLYIANKGLIQLGMD
jgi:L-glutamine-phosphate cytidylyltransferase